jgi:hypothetical protein
LVLTWEVVPLGVEAQQLGAREELYMQDNPRFRPDPSLDEIIRRANAASPSSSPQRSAPPPEPPRRQQQGNVWANVVGVIIVVFVAISLCICAVNFISTLQHTTSNGATDTSTDTPTPIPTDTPTPTATPIPNYRITSFTVNQTNVAWSNYAKFTLTLNMPVPYPIYIEVRDISSHNPGPYGYGDYGGACTSVDIGPTCTYETNAGNNDQGITITFEAALWDWYTKETLFQYPSSITVTWKGYQ